MPNTNLPESIVVDSGDLVGDAEIAWAEVNRLSRDTGWRDFSGSLAAGWGSGFAHIRRVDDLVTIRVNQLDASGASGNTFTNTGASSGAETISVGFAPDSPSNLLSSHLFRNSGAESFPFYFYWQSNAFRVGVTLGGAFASDFTTSGSAIEWSFKTDRAWPEFLPPAV